MNKQIKKYMIAGIFSFICLSGLAQQSGSNPSWVPEKGYWVVESNINSPLQHSIRFYNNENVLIGRKELGGVRLNPKKRKTKVMLNEILEASLLAWERHQKEEGAQVLVANPE